jgi:AcrR family transcriptional regulator
MGYAGFSAEIFSRRFLPGRTRRQRPLEPVKSRIVHAQKLNLISEFLQEIVPEPAGDKAQLIICAARDAFLEKGYDGVSMDEVASRAGVTKQTVYTRYASKDALFLAVVERPPGQMISAISGAESLPIRDRLQQIARELLDLVLDPSSLSLSRIAHGRLLSLSDILVFYLWP